jgi:hypothetical protein
MELLACALATPAARADRGKLASAAKLPASPAAVSGDDANEPTLTLRPAPGLELLASRVVRVLELRFGQGAIRVGGPPPPGLLEAVPAGHLALARDGDRVRLVLGAAFGAYFEASVPLAKQASEPEVRSLALAVEALRDRVFEAAERTNQAQAQAPVAGPSPQPTAAAAAQPKAAAETPRDRGATPYPPAEGEEPREVRPMFFVRMYSGASNMSSGLHMGIATGGGMCVQGHCLVISIESPVPGLLVAEPADVRYRYPTVTTSFYSRPWQFGVFAPAASVGFLSRVGYFNEDMGVNKAAGLESDLGIRGTLEASFRLYGALEFTAEAGIDYALDRWQLGTGENVAQRGTRATGWGQAGLRVRPY